MKNNLSEKLISSADKTIYYFSKKMRFNGDLGEDAVDISCYYKTPMMFIAACKPELAIKLLQFIEFQFMTKEGDFLTKQGFKSENPAYAEFWSYVNGWIVRAAQQVRMNSIIDSGIRYLAKYKSENSGYLTHHVELNDGVTDVLTTAHHGLINLETKKMDLSIEAGLYLIDMFRKQRKLENGFYLRADASQELITHFSNETSMFYFIDKNKPDQLYFMIGYPAAFLGLLYKETKKELFLEGAKDYLDFALTCNENVYRSNFSHKIAWASSIIYSVTEDEKYLQTIERITNHFFNIQSENGLWFTESGINTSYDQSAEIACWFIEISKHLKILEKYSHSITE